MQKNDRLYKETLRRVGKVEMFYTDQLLEQGYNGLAESHCVNKLLHYVETIEQESGVTVPSLAEAQSNRIKINSGGDAWYLHR